MKVFEFILLIYAVTSFHVYEKIPLNTYVAKVRKELKEILSFHFIEELGFPDFDYTEGEDTCTLSSVKTKAVFFNSFMPTPSLESQNPLILGCSWTAPENVDSYISPYHSIYRANLLYNNKTYPIEFELESKEFKFLKTWELYQHDTDNFYIPTGSVEITFVALKAKNLDEKSPFTQEVLLKVINAFISAKNEEMNQALNKGILAYYIGLPFEELMQKIFVQTTNIPYENNLDLTLEATPEYRETTGGDGFIIFKRKGTLNGENTGEGSLPADDVCVQRFNLDVSIYQKLIQENTFDIKFEQSNNPATLYELTGQYLNLVANSSLDNDTQLRLTATPIDITFETQNPMVGYIHYEINVVSIFDLNVVFSFSTRIKFSFTPILFQNGLKFVLLTKNLQLEDVYPEAGYDIIDKVLLMDWVANTYLCALGNNEYNLIEPALDLSYYFNTNDLSYEFLGNYLRIKKN